MKKSVLFFAVFLLVLIVAVLSERRGQDELSDSVAMGDNTKTELVKPNQLPE